MEFERMDINADSGRIFVDKLNSEPWWKTILGLNENEKDFNVQVRGDYLNVYYKMANFLKIEMAHGRIVASIHNKYLPLSNDRNKYVRLSTDDEKLSLLDNLPAEFIAKDLLNSENIKKITKEIDLYVGEEKKYQSKLIEKNKATILDAEVAMNVSNENGDTRTRIDLINYDKNIKKIVAVELKLLGNDRLYSDKICKQLDSYNNFMTEHEDDIKKAYGNSVGVKKALGLLSTDSPLLDIDWKSVEVETKPLLAIVAYRKSMIDSLKKEERIVERVQKHALGLYMFGKKVGDLNSVSRADRHKVIFT